LSSGQKSEKQVDPLVYLVDEAAALLQISPWMLYEMIRRDEVPGVVGLGKRNLRIVKSTFNDWISRGGSREAEAGS
jgi:excisionase family DNA binding protein